MVLQISHFKRGGPSLTRALIWLKSVSIQFDSIHQVAPASAKGLIIESTVSGSSLGVSPSKIISNDEFVDRVTLQILK